MLNNSHFNPSLRYEVARYGIGKMKKSPVRGQLK